MPIWGVISRSAKPTLSGESAAASIELIQTHEKNEIMRNMEFTLQEGNANRR